MQDWVVVVKARVVDLLNRFEFKMVVNLLLTTSSRGALTQLTSLAMIATLTVEKFSFSFFQSNAALICG